MWLAGIISQWKSPCEKFKGLSAESVSDIPGIICSKDRPRTLLTSTQKFINATLKYRTAQIHSIRITDLLYFTKKQKSSEQV